MALRDLLHVRLRNAVLKLEEAGDGIEAKWVQVAVEGEYLGYGGPDHPGFTFDRKTFEQVIANIHNHPSYKVGVSGFGEEGIIPWDFSHVSEQDPANGVLPLTGAPAQGWSSDGQIRNSPLGKAELWMLTKFDEPARTYVLSGQYKWASVALSFESVDPQTNEPTGALITSIALTNMPFIEGMSQLAAERRSAAGTVTSAAGATASRCHYFEAADSPAKAIEMMKELFALPETALVADVATEVGKVSAWVTAGEAPIGVDVDEIISSLRTILNMPAFSTSEDVLALVNSNIQILSDQTIPLTDTLEKQTMDILKVIATLLGVGPTQDAVTAELESLIGLRDKLISLFSMEPTKATMTAIFQTAADAHKGAETLHALCGALIAKDGNEAISMVAALQAAGAELEKLKPEMLELQKAQEAAEAVDVKVDVDRAIASNAAFDETMRPMFELSRKADKDAFLAKYPMGDVPAATPDAATLTTSVAATVAGTQLAVVPAAAPGIAPAAVPAVPAVTVDPLTGAITRPAPAPIQAAAPVSGQLGGQVVNLALYPGVTDTQRMVMHLTATRPGFDKLVWDDQFEAACLALTELKKAAA